MAKTISEGYQSSLGTKESILSGKNYTTNPRFSGTTNGWSGTSDKSLASNGVTLSVGSFYQTLSTYDIEEGENYMARALVGDITGLPTMDIGTTQGGAELGGVELQSGWNCVKFQGSTSNILSFTIPSGGSLRVQEVQVNKQIDMYVTGNFLNV